MADILCSHPVGSGSTFWSGELLVEGSYGLVLIAVAQEGVAEAAIAQPRIAAALAHRKEYLCAC